VGSHHSQGRLLLGAAFSFAPSIQCLARATTVRVIHQQSTAARRYRAHVDYPKLDTALLKDVDDRFYYGANCSSCLHASRLSLSKLRAHLGADLPVVKIRRRLKCDLCGSKAVTITYLTPSQCTGSLVHLFDKKPK
jgi:hypothetical protein